MNYKILLEKISKAKFSLSPFKYLYIKDFIPKDEFISLTSDPQVILEEANNDMELIYYIKVIGNPFISQAVLQILMTI